MTRWWITNKYAINLHGCGWKGWAKKYNIKKHTYGKMGFKKCVESKHLTFTSEDGKTQSRYLTYWMVSISGTTGKRLYWAFSTNLVVLTLFKVFLIMHLQYIPKSGLVVKLKELLGRNLHTTSALFWKLDN